MGSELMVSIPPIAAITWLILFSLKKIGVPTKFFPLISNIVALGIAILVAVKSGGVDILVVLTQAISAGAMAVQGEDIKDRIFQNKKYVKIVGSGLEIPELTSSEKPKSKPIAKKSGSQKSKTKQPKRVAVGPKKK